MRHHIVIEIDITGPSEPVCYHHIDTPGPGEKDFYRQSVSFNYYFGSLTGRNHSKTRIYHWTDEIMVKHCQYDVPIVKHDGIWEFYKYIGYDYKKQKYVN